MMYKNGVDSVDAFRDQQRQQARERHERILQQDREQKERIAAEEEAAKLPDHEAMKQQTAEIKAIMWKLHPGDVHAIRITRKAVLDTLTILQYVLEKIGLPDKGEI